MSLEEKGDIEKAIEKYNKVLEINPKHPRSIYELRECFCLCGDCHTAIKYYKKAISLDDGTNNFVGGLLASLNYSADMSAEEIFGYYIQFDQVWFSSQG